MKSLQLFFLNDSWQKLVYYFINIENPSIEMLIDFVVICKVLKIFIFVIEKFICNKYSINILKIINQ